MQPNIPIHRQRLPLKLAQMSLHLDRLEQRKQTRDTHSVSEWPDAELSRLQKNQGKLGVVVQVEEVKGREQDVSMCQGTVHELYMYGGQEQKRRWRRSQRRAESEWTRRHNRMSQRQRPERRDKQGTNKRVASTNQNHGGASRENRSTKTRSHMVASAPASSPVSIDTRIWCVI